MIPGGWRSLMGLRMGAPEMHPLSRRASVLASLVRSLHTGALESVGMRCLALAALCIPLTSGSVRAVVDDAWDWYSAMSPYEQCIDYLAGDPDIEQVLAKDLSYCDGLWGSPESE